MVKLKKLERQIGTLDIRKFMHQYYGISHNDISKMTHDVASDFFPNLKRTSFTHLDKYPELVSCGQVVLVRDNANNIAPYIVPNTAALARDPQFDMSVLIERVIASLKITSELSESTVIVIEGEDSLDELLQKERPRSDTKELVQTLIEVTKENDVDGIVISSEGDVNKVKFTEHSPEELSAKTDSIAIILEEDKSYTFIVGGYSQNDFDLIMLRTGLYYCLDYVVYEKEEKEPFIKLSKKDFDNLSNYELICLMHKYKYNNQLSYYHAARRELKRRKTNTRIKEKSRQKTKKIREEE